MSTLSDYELQIETLLAALAADPNGELIDYDEAEFEEDDPIVAGSTPLWLDTAVRLSRISQKIRQTLWNSRDIARQIAARADQAAGEIRLSHGDMPQRPLPRFESLISGGIFHPEID